MTGISIDLNAPAKPVVLPFSFIAKTLNVSRETVGNWSATGVLPRARKIGGRMYLVASEFEAFLANLPEAEPADENAATPA